MKAICWALLSSAVVSTYATAQTPDHLVGLTRNTPALLRYDHPNCQVQNACPVPLPSTGAVPQAAGGTGWDPVRSGAWVTNGSRLMLVDDDCNVLCQPVPIPAIGVNQFATGVDVVESQGRILVIDNLGRLHTFSNACPPVAGSVCATGLGPQNGFSTTGIAADEGRGLVFVSYANFTTGQSRIAVLPLANPCQVICTLPVQAPCTVAFHAITGLACDWGNRILYATDGRNTLAIDYLAGAACVQFTGIDCCTPPVIAIDPLVGLAVRPGRATSTGQGCGNGACQNCPMRHSLANDPALGNAQFRLRLDQAPVGSLSWCIFGTAPCTPPGVSVPGLCGPIFTPQPLLGILGPNVVPGGLPCSGSTTFSFPLPAWPSLAGWTISSQCVNLCTAAAGPGTAVSNCISYTFQGI